jgi:signal transduction histidine kinase
MTARNPLILYVDDEQANRIVFEQSFARTFHVQTVASGPEALDFMAREPVAVLVTDQRMPHMTGHDLLIRVKEQFPDVVRMVITAYSDLDAILDAVNLGLVARYIIKPWNRAELTDVLKWAVQVHQLGRDDSTLLLRLMANERLATLGSIAGAMIHDLNQPLASLKLNADELKRHVADVAEDPAAVKELLTELPSVANDIAGATDLMRDIVEGMRRFLHAERHPEASATAPVPVIQTAVRLCKESAVLASAEIVYDGPSTLPPVRLGATQLSQVFLNLISNAAQALGRRSGGPGKVLVHAAALPTEQAVRFTVEDNGPGMTPEVLAKVGTRFFSTTQEGTGLGVAQCQRLVGAAGGELQIKSEPGKGTAVTFKLPLA